MTQITPFWLRAGSLTPDLQNHAIPALLRLPLRLRGRAHVVALIDETGQVLAEEPVGIQVLSASGVVLDEGQVVPPLGAVFLPKGTASITTLSPRRLRLGLYPSNRLALKLWTFLTGDFPGRAPHRRWRDAAAAARDLRGAHAALLETSQAMRAKRATRYRRLRTAFTADFQAIVPSGAGLRLTLVSHLPEGLGLAFAKTAWQALRTQTDPMWNWVLVLDPATPAELVAWAEEMVGQDPRCRAIRLPSPPTPGMLLAQTLANVLAQDEGGPAAEPDSTPPLDPRDAPLAELPLDGALMPDAVAMVRAAFHRHRDCQLVYTDEEAYDTTGQPQEGRFKPAYNRYLLRSLDYLGHLVAVRGGSLRQVLEQHGTAGHSRHALRLALCEMLAPAAIRHIPRIAFSAPERPIAPATREDANAVSQLLKVEVSLAENGALRALYPLPDPPPLVSLVIPTRDRAELIGLALRSLIAKTLYRDFEIIIVDNGSVEPKTFALFEEIKAAWPRTRIVRDDGDFNYPRICNAGVKAASGSLICLLNNDIEVVDGGWLGEMVSLAVLPDTGIVGAKLLFPDRTVQHAGVIVGLFDYAAHWFTHAAPDTPGPLARLVVRSNMSAVTGACLLISRLCWEAIGPLDEERFAEDCNDIDLCLRARAGGFEVVWTPFACLIHHESASRGRRRSRAHRNRLKAQRARMETRWQTSILVDPHYNPNQSRTSLNAGVAHHPEGPRDPRTDAIGPPFPDAR